MNSIFGAVDALFEADTPIIKDDELVETSTIATTSKKPELNNSEPYITLKNAKGNDYTIYKNGRDYYSEDNVKLTEDEIEDMRKNEIVYTKMEDKAKKVLDTFLNSDKSIESFTSALNEISRFEWENEIDVSLYDKYIKLLQNAYVGRELVTEGISDEKLEN